jgi:polyhydroxyalkanoate synthesis regulator phasin
MEARRTVDPRFVATLIYEIERLRKVIRQYQQRRSNNLISSTRYFQRRTMAERKAAIAAMRRRFRQELEGPLRLDFEQTTKERIQKENGRKENNGKKDR